MRERNILALIIVALVLAALGYLAATRINILPVQASSRAVLVDQLFQVLLGVATVIFFLVQGGLIYAVIRFRRKPGDDSDGPPTHGNTSLEIVWTMIPALIVLVVSVYSYRVLTRIEDPPGDAMVVEVVGRQFNWEFRYPETGASSVVLHLPVGQKVRFEIVSDDVIHSFWIPAFRAKRDATPGQISELVITPTRRGVYPIRCAELCGIGHADMSTEVVVESRADFNTWMDTITSLPTDPIEAGRVLFANHGCAACHALADAGADGTVGPVMDGIGLRAGDRVAGLTAREFVIASILKPNELITEGFQANVMPLNFSERISDEELELLVDYLLAQE